ncbi:uncharacterized protein UTRI_01561 [Ustilago trichophora]|uniref:Uncharacterized protein n=1 Tax=Ustilago trichophora TaxID=86804 RepID=A0A5C3DWR4_9BASI|nr:uncharacterized protein UTRI_01561 [Ustilago trichophora]
MPARTFSEADRSEQSRPQHRSISNTWSPYVGSASTATAAVAESKRMAGAGASSPGSPHKRPWGSSPERTGIPAGHDSAEEDELSDELSPNLQNRRSPHHHQRPAASKRKEGKVGSSAPSPKRSKRINAELSPASRVSYTSGHARHPLSVCVDDATYIPLHQLNLPSFDTIPLPPLKVADISQSKEAHSRSPSPRSRMTAPSIDRSDDPSAGRSSDQSLSLDEIDTFLDLIYKHHPEPMTAETMRKSVETLYHDWEQYCARRQVPVRLAKKPLMDEYGKIFNGVYGSELQAKARSIAHELSQRAANASISGDASDDKDAQRRHDSSRRSLTRSSTEEDSEDEEADDGDETMGGDVAASGASLLGKKKAEADESGSSKKSNIAQVGRNGLAVLPPGLFDILRNHLRDDILSSIMPSVRNDLTEQTRELFLQNQDLFGRIKEMEDRIRNQDLWIRHLLSRDPAEIATPPVGSHISGGGEPGSGLGPRSRPFSASARDPASLGKHPRHGPLSSEGEMGSGAPIGDYFGGAGAMSPRQPPRNEPRHSTQQGMTTPHPWDGRSPAAAAGPSMGSGPGSAAGPSNAFGSGRWEAEGPPPGAYRDRPPAERRPSYATEPHRRPGSWQGEPQVGRAFRSHNHPGDRPDLLEGRHEPPTGPQPGNPRLSLGERRRLSAFGGVASGSRGGGAPAPPPLSTGLSVGGGMHDEFRRPGPPMHPREPAMSPISPAYDTRRPHHGLPVSHSEPYFASSEPIKAPLPPRAITAASPEQMQKNKRGRPSKAEMANSRAELGPSGRGSFSGGSHPSTQSRPYMS